MAERDPALHPSQIRDVTKVWGSWCSVWPDLGPLCQQTPRTWHGGGDKRVPAL